LPNSAEVVIISALFAKSSRVVPVGRDRDAHLVGSKQLIEIVRVGQVINCICDRDVPAMWARDCWRLLAVAVTDHENSFAILRNAKIPGV
jgi:hypothetical protein